MDFLKAIEYLGKGIFDSIVTTPYALAILQHEEFQFWGLGGIFSLRNSRIPQRRGCLEFQKRHPLTPRKSRIPKSRIPRLNSRIPRDCFASLAMTKILEFPKSCVIPRLDRGISSQINLEFSASLRGSKATEAISFKA